MFDAKTKRYVAGSAAFAGRELAEGFVTKGQRLIVQGCRFRGRAKHARVSVAFLAVPARARGRTQVVEVSTPTRADKTRLQGLGLDLTESGDANSIDVVIAGDADARKLRAAKLHYRVKIADLAARARANRARPTGATRSGPPGRAAAPPEREDHLPPPRRLRAGAEAAGASAIRGWCARSRCPIARTSAVTCWASR